MRDPDRIRPFCDEFAELWSNYPDLRFGQIMINIARYMQLERRSDIFFTEDDAMMDILREYLGKVDRV